MKGTDHYTIPEYEAYKAGKRVAVEGADLYIKSLIEIVVVLKNLNMVPTETTMKKIEEMWERWHAEEIAEAQTEISFKAGVREVVEAVGQRCYTWHDETNRQHICLDIELWEAKKKEWGI
uniref:Uncharacterized protein n=1 Tax=viral metagenome TaxID=1070528 RepID=A0A6M3LKD4_9ZZZZ